MDSSLLFYVITQGMVKIGNGEEKVLCDIHTESDYLKLIEFISKASKTDPQLKEKN